MMLRIGCESRAARAALISAAMLSGGAVAGDACAPSWSAIPGPDRFVFDLLVHDDGTGPALFAAGNFDTVAGIEAEMVAKWDGTAWSPLLGPNGLGLRGNDVFRLASYDSGAGPELYAVGIFDELPDGRSVPGVAKWNGTDWSAIHDPSLPLPFSNGAPVIQELFVHDDGRGEALYAMGGMLFVGPNRPYSIARWDGQGWTPLSEEGGLGPFAVAYAAEAFDDGTGEALFVSGISYQPEFDSVKVAKWDTAAWTVLPDPPGFGGFPTIQVNALAVFDDGSGERLFAALSSPVGGPSALAAWDGVSWEIIEDGISGAIERMRVLDDDAGPALFLMGDFFAIDGRIMGGLARWDGDAFTPFADGGGTGVGGGFNKAWSIAPFDAGNGPDFYVGGEFLIAGGNETPGLAVWDLCLPGACPADLEQDGVLDLADLVAFVSAFTSADPLADFAEPEGVFDLADLVAFVTAFNAGCP